MTKNSKVSRKGSFQGEEPSFPGEPSGFMPLKMPTEEEWQGFLEFVSNSQKTGFKDKNGRDIRVGDVVAELVLEEVVWDGWGVIKARPYGVVVRVGKNKYNIKELSTGVVRLKKGCKMYDERQKQRLNPNYSPIFMSKYDGQFQWPGCKENETEDAGEIEIIGHIVEDD